jgi:phosphopantothenoylcysteine decarboxylase / phosphopantothenate---cysteine ligase
MTLRNRRVLLAVTGGIAAYKAAELTRRLRDAGAEVGVVMTAAAQAFVSPLTFQALSGRPVHTELLSAQAESAMGHIALARWAELVLVAPCTADALARLAHGLADDLLGACWLATRSPRAVAPAMNARMLEHPATQRNLAQLRADGVHVLGPASGAQACGEVGEGRLLEPDALVAACAALFGTGALEGVRAVVSAGPTYEDLDPVRYLGNRSSGRMGYAIAQAAHDAGAQVTLVTGPVALEPPPVARVVRVRSAADMHEAVLDAVRGADLYIGAAAVADYRPASAANAKMKKDAPRLTVTLERNPDILAAVCALRPKPLCVGFAAETQDLEAGARAKLAAKGADLIAANLVGAGRGFEVEDNALLVVWRDGARALGPAPKTALAREFVALLAQHLKEPRRAGRRAQSA